MNSSTGCVGTRVELFGYKMDFAQLSSRVVMKVMYNFAFSKLTFSFSEPLATYPTYSFKIFKTLKPQKLVFIK